MCLLAALLLHADASWAQPSSPNGPVTWTHVVEAYLAERLDDAARVIELPPDDAARQAREALDAWTTQAREQGEDGARAHEVRRFVIRRLQASALLPLEVLVRISSRGPVSDTMIPLEHIAAEAWERLTEFETVHLDVPGDAGRKAREQGRLHLERFRGRWQVAFLQYLVNAGRHRQARDLLARMRLQRTDATAQAEASLLEGMLDEHAGRMADEGAVRSAMGNTVPMSRLRGIGTRLDDALHAYRRALQAMPLHREARLRLGRVELERQRPADAVRTLAPLRVSPCRTLECGLAWLFTGEAHEATGGLADASRAYVQASTVQMLRQSSLVALMQLALRRDNPRQAFDLTSQFTAESPLATIDQPDAWSDYLTGRRADAAAVLTPLREALLP